MRFKDSWLRCFYSPDGGAGSGAAAEGGSGATTGAQEATDAALQAQAEREARKNPNANMRYGVQPEGQTAPQAEEQNQPEQMYTKADVSRIVQDRLKNSKHAEETLNKLAPLLEDLSAKYGTPKNDLDALVKAYDDDPAQYEDEALEKGIPVETVKQLRELQRYKDAEADAAQKAQVQAHYSGLVNQAAELQRTFPGFDLQAELKNNPEFLRLTSPQIGMSVSDAYYVTHRQEIERQAIAAGQRSGMQTAAQAYQANSMRPSEGGLHSAPSANIVTDPRQLTRAQREDIRRRVANGERIAW